MSSVFVNSRTLGNGQQRWRLQFRLDGRQQVRTFLNEPVARRWEAVFKAVGVAEGLRMLDALDDPNEPEPGALTVADLIDRHLAALTGVTAGTRQDYRRICDADIVPTLGHVPAAAFDRAQVAAWLNRLERTPDAKGRLPAAKTIANKHGLLSAVCASAVERGDLPKNPCRGMKLPAGTPRTPVFLSAAQVRELVDALPEVWRPLILVMAGTGLRWGEVTALRGRDVTVTDTAVTVRVERAWKRPPAGPMVIGPPKSARSRRVIPLRRPSVVADTLATRAKERPGDRLLFTTPRGAAIRSGYFHDRAWTRTVDSLAEKGWTVRPRVHDLRHTAASLMIAAGQEVHAVSAILGHEQVTTTLEIYGHFQPGARESALSALGAALAAEDEDEDDSD